MSSITEIFNANNIYEQGRKKLDELYNKTKLINDELDLDEVINTLNYSETKALYRNIMFCNNNENKFKKLKVIMEEKKANEYPEILGVHYYPIIKDIDFLTEDEKLNLDITIKNICTDRNKRKEIASLGTKIIDYLIQNKIIEKQYIFHCTCGSDECYDEVITQERFDKLKDYWEKALKDETTREENIKMNYGCFETGCWNDGNVEVCSLDDFNEHLRRIEYKIIQNPDMTLDNI